MKNTALLGRLGPALSAGAYVVELERSCTWSLWGLKQHWIRKADGE